MGGRNWLCCLPAGHSSGLAALSGSWNCVLPCFQVFYFLLKHNPKICHGRDRALPKLPIVAGLLFSVGSWTDIVLASRGVSELLKSSFPSGKHKVLMLTQEFCCTSWEACETPHPAMSGTSGARNSGQLVLYPSELYRVVCGVKTLVGLLSNCEI